jgi:hypothetical protein
LTLEVLPDELGLTFLDCSAWSEDCDGRHILHVLAALERAVKNLSGGRIGDSASLTEPQVNLDCLRHGVSTGCDT